MWHPLFIVSASQVPSIWNKIWENKVKYSSCYLRVQALVQLENKKNTIVLLRTERLQISDISKPVTKYICSIMELGRSFWACDLECTCACVWDWESETDFWFHVKPLTVNRLEKKHLHTDAKLASWEKTKKSRERQKKRERDGDDGRDRFIGSPGVKKSSPSYWPRVTRWRKGSHTNTSCSLCVRISMSVSVSVWPKL